MIFVPLIGILTEPVCHGPIMGSNVRESVQYYSTTPQDQTDCVEWMSQCTDNQFSRHIFFLVQLFPVTGHRSEASVSISQTGPTPPGVEIRFLGSNIWIWHRIFTDALPDTNLLIYPGLGSAIRNALAPVYPVAWEQRKAHTDEKLQRESELILALNQCTRTHATSVESMR